MSQRWGLALLFVVPAALAAFLVGTPLGLTQVVPEIALAPTSGPAGQLLAVSGSGFLPALPVEIRWDGSGGPAIGNDNADADGGFEVRVNVPSTAAPGIHVVFACQPFSFDPSMCDREASVRFTVIVLPTTTSPTTTVPIGSSTTSSTSSTSSTFPLSQTTTTLGGDPPQTTLPDFAIMTTTSVFGIQNPGSSFPDLIAYDIEITQGAQNVESTMPLVAGRNTWARVYMKTDGVDLSGVKALLRIQKDGEEVIVEPDYPWPKYAVNDGGERKIHVNNFSFLIPNKWTDTGQTIFSAFVYWSTPDETFALEPNIENNYTTKSHMFREGHDPNIYLIRLWPGGDQPVVTPAENTAAPNWMGPQLMARHPISAANFYPIFQHVGPLEGEWNLDDDPGAALDRLEWVRSYFDLPAEDWVLGYVHPDALDKWAGFGRGSSAVGFTIQNEDTMAHEAGHMIGLSHVPCKDTKAPIGEPDELLGGSIDPTHPNGFPECQYADTDPEGFFGSAVYTTQFHPTMYPNDPSDDDHRWPLLGYQRPRWIDPFHYCKMLNYYEVSCDPVAVGVRPKFIPPTEPVDCTPESSGGFNLELCFTQDSVEPFAVIPEVNDLVLVVNATGDGKLEIAKSEDPTPYMLQRMESNLDFIRSGEATQDNGDLIGAFNFRVEIAGINGVLLDMPLLSRDADAEGTIPHFFEVLPCPDGAEIVRIYRDDDVIATLDVSSSVPTVNILTPNGGEAPDENLLITWEAFDADGDDLTYTILYSADGGDTYQPIVTGYLWNDYNVTDLNDLAGSGQGVIKVIASDGFNTGMDTSDGFFSIPNSRPTATILQPIDGNVYPIGGKVLLDGVGTDREDGRIEDGLVWTSDLDGEIATGSKAVLTDLSLGVHTITLAVTDSDGAVGASATHIKIDDALVIPPPDDVALNAGVEVFARFDNSDFAVSPTTTEPGMPLASDETGGPGTPIALWIAGGVLLLLGIGGGIYMKKKRPPSAIFTWGKSPRS